MKILFLMTMLTAGGLSPGALAMGVDFSGAPGPGQGGTMPVAGIGLVGYLTPKVVVRAEPVRWQTVQASTASVNVPARYRLDPAGSAVATLTTIPEPGSTAILLLTGLLAVVRRRR